jgi:hypothetical protein
LPPDALDNVTNKGVIELGKLRLLPNNPTRSRCDIGRRVIVSEGGEVQWQELSLSGRQGRIWP